MRSPVVWLALISMPRPEASACATSGAGEVIVDVSQALGGNGAIGQHGAILSND